MKACRQRCAAACLQTHRRGVAQQSLLCGSGSHFARRSEHLRPQAAMSERASQRFVIHVFDRSRQSPYFIEPSVETYISRACSASIESWGFSWVGEWESLSALIRFWEAERCRKPILGTCGCG